jgi:hypothetical protein
MARTPQVAGAVPKRAPRERDEQSLAGAPSRTGKVEHAAHAPVEARPELAHFAEFGAMVAEAGFDANEAPSALGRVVAGRPLRPFALLGANRREGSGLARSPCARRDRVTTFAWGARDRRERIALERWRHPRSIGANIVDEHRGGGGGGGGGGGAPPPPPPPPPPPRGRGGAGGGPPARRAHRRTPRVRPKGVGTVPTSLVLLLRSR